jgi:hypothetical protein
VIYLDSSAIMKLVTSEPETASLGAWLAAREGIPVSSAVAEVEVCRAAVRAGVADPVGSARRVLAGVVLVGVTSSVRATASTLPDPLLRSLDAIHVATAVEPSLDVDTLVTYDGRMARAAAGLVAVASPGASAG